MRSKIMGLVTVGLLAGPTAASAGLLGQEFAAAYYFPDASTIYASASFTPAIFTIGAGMETNGDIEGVTFVPVDFTDGTLTVILNTVLLNPTWNATAFNGIIFTATLPHGITGASVDASTTLAGFDNSRLSFDDTRILLNWQGLSYLDGQQVNVNFAFAAVPEPGTLALLGLGLAGVGFSLRRRS